MVKEKKIRVHVIHGPNLNMLGKREEFRHKSMLADIVTGQITGLGSLGYTLALNAIAEDINEK